MTVFWAFGILLICLLVFVVAIRHRFMAWGWNFALVAIILYTGLFKMTGNAREAYLFSSIEQVHGDVAVLWYMAVPNKFIYLLVTKKHSEAPYYLQLPWTKSLDQELQQAAMEAQKSQSEVQADADALSEWMTAADKVVKQKGQKGDDQGNENGETDDIRRKLSLERGQDGYVDKEYKPNVFHPRPVPPDPNKDYRTTIEGPSSGPIPDVLGPEN